MTKKVSNNGIIDIVVTWVDGSDPLWQEQRSRTFPDASFSSNQYRDWGLLKYWFRGIENYAPWVNKVFFVTWGHVPSFLNLDHPKIQIIRHEDYMPKDYLPTFNSNPIELNLHRIEALSDKFVYFNDDMYLINNTKPEDWFDNGVPKDVAILNPIVAANSNSISGIMLNNMGVINEEFSLRKSIQSNFTKWYNYKYGTLNLLNLLFLPWKNAVGLYQQHLPSSMLKSTFEEVWEKKFDILHATSLRKRRNNKSDVNQWLFKEWQVMKGNFSPRSVKFGKYVMVKDIDNLRKVDELLFSKVKTICINDHLENDIENVMESLVNSFEKKFPKKSSYEK